ncbi:Uncharacterised protein [Chlamydia trachomatis]|nr:Uncharacterised protein [Chlamydia trachomatis]
MELAGWLVVLIDSFAGAGGSRNIKGWATQGKTKRREEEEEGVCNIN